MTADPDYFNRVNKNILEVIPPNAKTVLEIGCGAGALCEAYRRINPGVKWLGIEKNEDVHPAAIANGIDVFQCDAEGDLYADSWQEIEASWVETKEMYRQEIDCLILGDILEHLNDPWAVLKRYAKCVRPGAQVLASIPNVQHYTVLMHLMTGFWRYGDSGLLDRTHLRFFTLNSIRELFEGAGLQIFEIRGCVEGGDRWEEWLEIAKRIPLSTENIKESRCVQYLVRAYKPTDEATSGIAKVDENGVMIPDSWKPYATIPRLHIHAVLGEDCCARPRIREPLAMIGTVPGVKVTACSQLVQDPTGDVGKCDILILQRDRWYKPDTYRHHAFRGEHIVIAEIDDHPAHLQGMERDKFFPLRACHAIQCSTEALAEVCCQYNPHVFVFENQIAELPPLREGHDGYVKIFFGAQNRQSDWEPIMPALNRVLADHAHQVYFHVIHDREFYDAIQCRHKEFWPFLEYEAYRRNLGLCDIALLPLKDTPFNRCKSDLKFLECAAEGVTVLGSDIAIGHLWCRYPESPQAACYVGRDGFESGLRFLIEKPNLRRDAAQRAYTYVRDHRLLSQHYHRLHEWYLSLLTSRQALQADLLARVPELGPRPEPAVLPDDRLLPVPG